MKRLPELVGGTSSLGWVAVKAVLMFAVTIVGLRLGKRRTLAQLGAFAGAVTLVTLLVAHRLVAFARRHNRMASVSPSSAPAWKS